MSKLWISRNARAGQVGPDDPQHRSRIVLVGRPTVLNEGLRRAIQSHCSDHAVEHWDSAIEPRPANVDTRLLLIQLADGHDARETIAKWRTAYPSSPIGLICDMSDDDEADHDALLQAGVVQGILPHWLALDVWLAAVVLLLCGGEYAPPSIGRRQRPPSMEFAAPQSRPSDTEGAAVEAVAGLTPRETQILELLSVGFQNKSIASRMELSEHTVKVHVHNIIQKLRVTNRTQAADLFRRRSPNGRAGYSFLGGG